MPRPALHVRHAQVDDVDVLLDLWSRTMPGALGPATRRDEALAALGRVVTDDDESLLLAERNGVVIGALSLRAAHVGPLQTTRVLHTSYLLVHPDHRSQGCARTLLEAAVEWAEDQGIEQVTAITDSGSRDNNRFLARLGFTPMATFRHAQTVALRVKLTGDRSVRRNTADRQLVQVLVHRRSMRRRSSTARAVAQGATAIVSTGPTDTTGSTMDAAGA